MSGTRQPTLTVALDESGKWYEARLWDGFRVCIASGATKEEAERAVRWLYKITTAEEAVKC